jgi:hypothetical protein
MLRNNAMLKREMLINTKLPLGVAFGDSSPPNRTSLFAHCSRGTSDGASGGVVP